MRKRRKSNSKPNNRSQEPPVVRTSNRGDICVVPRQLGLTSLVGKMLMTLALVGGASHSIAADVLRRGNQVAWCIVPFDAAKRGPAERAAMLKELGITKCAYDWRAEHVPTFEQEILEYKKQGIEFFAFWSAHDEAFKLFKKHNLHPQIWQTLGDPGGDDAAKVEAATQLMLPLAKRTAGLGCKLGLYNHGGWGGEPANLVAVCRRLRELGQGHVGIVYNFHHGHGHIDDWAASFRLMQPYLHCLNLNGMNDAAQPKILGIGKGAHELDMIRVVVESGYDGPIGILDHRDQLDARKSLIENRDGLEWVRKEIEKPGSGGPKPIAPAAPMPKKQAAVDGGRIVPGSDAYRHPPITVEVRVNLSRRDRYNILVASDSKASANHWELFTMNGSGYLTAYLPGKTPDHVRSEAMVCDGKPHTLSMTYAPDRVQLFVDGKRVADEAIAARDDGTAVPGELAIGRLVGGGLGCEGTIEWVRISRGVRNIASEPVVNVPKDETTVGLWVLKDGVGAVGVTRRHGLGSNNRATSLPRELPYDAGLVADLIAGAQKHGDAVRGAGVFTNAKLACLSCHKVGQHGGTVGPELTAVAKDRKLNHIVESILWPKRDVKPEFTTWQVVTVSGKVVTGYLTTSEANDEPVTLRDPASGKLTSIARGDIEEMEAGSTVMPDGLTAAMTRQQQLDLIRFLSELGRDGQPLAEELQHAIAHSQMHGPATFPVTVAPIDAARWPNATHPVNRDRLYDFYTKQADYFRRQHHVPMLLAPFPGLDGGQQGHWGNQNEDVWRDGRWNAAKLGSVQAGVLHAKGKAFARAICVRLGDEGELSACFNPDSLSYEAVWSDGFVRFDDVRHGFVGGLKLDGELAESSVEIPKSKAIADAVKARRFKYRGFYRHGKRVVFAYRIGGVEYLDAPWVAGGKFVREVAPANEHSLRHLTEGGRAQWPQIVNTNVVPGTARPYAVDTIELPFDNPWNVPVFCGGHDFLPDGTALVCTMQGDVWRVTGLGSGTKKTGVAKWKRFASGLHHPLGLVVANGDIYVQCRDQLMRLTDLNNDGEADFYECFSNAFETSPAGHDFICGLQRNTDGNFYTASGNQGLLRISADGQTAEVIATGFRNPDGLGILPDGTLTLPVSEGEWTPASAINAIRPFSPKAEKVAEGRMRGAVRQTASDIAKDSNGKPLTLTLSPSRGEGTTAGIPDESETPPHFGYRGPRGNQPPELPLCYLPRGMDNSSGGQVFVNSDRFGPLKNQLVHLSFGAGTWFVVLRDEVEGQLQGAIVPMSGDFLSGVHRGRFSPVDGQLYVSGMAGWGSYTPDDGCFHRVRYTGDPVQVPTGFHVHENGVRVTFAEPIDEAVAADVRQQFAQCWNYRYSGAYGSLEYSTTHPGIAGHDPLAITSAHVSNDGRSLFLEISDIQPVSQLHLRMHVNNDEPFSCNPTGSGHDLFITVHKLDQPFTDFRGYEPRDKIIAAHPLLADMALNAVRVPNPWRRKIANAREIEIRTGKNLTYETREFTVKANEPLAFTLSNPDVVPHNWVLVQPGALREVGELANQLIASPEAYARHYVPETDKVLAYTDIVSPGQPQTIYFKAPAKPGRYPYLCTFPGHWMVMNGVMVVK